MREPFYRSKKTVDRIALVIAILSVLIFVFSCVFNVYSYAITPTITPTFTSTATITKTPQPTATPTATPTTTLTATQLIPSQTVTPTVDPIVQRIIPILNELSEREFVCSYSLQEETNLIVECIKEAEAAQIQVHMEYVVIEELSFNIEQVQINPSVAVTNEVITAEILWLSQLPNTILGDPTPTSTAATPSIEVAETVTAEETIDLSTWLAENLLQLTEDQPLQFEQDQFVYTISIDGESFSLTIENIE